jgi:hypothetical protein
MVSVSFEFVGAVMDGSCIEFTKLGNVLWMKVHTCVANNLGSILLQVEIHRQKKNDDSAGEHYH